MIQDHTSGRRDLRPARLLFYVLLATPFAHAADDESGVYLGAQLYGARFSDADLTGGDDISGGLTFGWRINRAIGIEASAKKTHFDVMSIDPSAQGIRGKGVHGIELALRGQHDFSDRFAATAKVGVYDWRGGHGHGPHERSGTDAVVGVGLMMLLSSHTSLTSEYQRILGFEGIGEDDLIGLGLRVDFD